MTAFHPPTTGVTAVNLSTLICRQVSRRSAIGGSTLMGTSSIVPGRNCERVLSTTTATDGASPSPSSTMSSKPSVAIIGGGIGGLTVANALLHRQVVSRVTLYERAPYFVPTAGAGFGFSPNGQICLASIGIPASTQQTLLHPFKTLARANEDGTDIVAQSNAFDDLQEQFGFSIAGTLRADLVDLLVQTLHEKHEKAMEQQLEQSLHVSASPSSATSPSSPIRYNHKLVSIEQSADEVKLEFENGHSDTVDMVVGADGINSTVSKLLDIDETPPIYSGANIFYGVIPNPDELPYVDDDDANPVQSLLSKDHTVIQYAGPGECLSFRVGPPNRKKMVWACTYVSDGPPTPHGQDWDQARDVQHELETKLLYQYPPDHPLHWFAKMTPPSNDETTPGVLHFGLYRRQHKKTWYKGRVVLLGDSCHATLPYVGQGANQAIEDAIVLADCLHQQIQHQETTRGSSSLSIDKLNVEDLTSVFQAYYERRFNRTKRVVNMATVLNYLYHTQFPPARFLMDWLITQFVQGGLIFKQIEKELLDECPVKDYDLYRLDPKKS